jgi:SAM-dependent methyltransferase
MSASGPTVLEGASPSDLGLPDDYYDRLFEVEQRHWWQRGMRRITLTLLGGRLETAGQHLLDAGCGSGGFLRWAAQLDAFDSASGVDASRDAIELARGRAPDARLVVARVSELPFPDSSFDVAFLNDVLQHIPEDEVQASLAELRRTLGPGGALLVRTGGAARAREERADWRIYDSAALIATLRAAGFSCERTTYANMVPSLVATVRGHAPRAPTRARHGIPSLPGTAAGAIGYGLLRFEGALLAHPRGRLPYGHTLFGLATPLP